MEKEILFNKFFFFQSRFTFIKDEKLTRKCLYIGPSRLDNCSAKKKKNLNRCHYIVTIYCTSDLAYIQRSPRRECIRYIDITISDLVLRTLYPGYLSAVYRSLIKFSQAHRVSLPYEKNKKFICVN